MTDLTLQREKQTKYGTFGHLAEGTKELCKTLERLWLNNASLISCIPTGLYKCTVEKSVNFPYLHYRLHDIKDRVDILIHKGNWLIDTHGCILVGMTATEKGIEQSKIAMDMLIKVYPQGFNLTVKD